MSFTGKATYLAGTALPELAEDVADIVAIMSPHETPLLDALGDPLREATGTHHEWLEDAPGDRKERVKGSNQTQIFTTVVEVNPDVAGTQLGLTDEMDFQKQERLRGMLHDLENCVINGGQPTNGQHTNPPVTRKMNGILTFLKSNVIDAGGKSLDEEQITAMLRRICIWQNSSGNVDLIIVGGFQKRKMDGFCTPAQKYLDTVWLYESDFGICRIVATRWIPHDSALFLDSSRISVLPLTGHSFHFKPLTSANNHECGELIGEYTLELKNEAAHGLIHGLATV